MRICQILLNKNFGGAERAFVDISLSLAELGYQVLVLIDRDFCMAHLFERVENITLKRIRVFSRFDPVTRFSVLKALKVFKPQIAHVHLRRALTVSYSSIRAVNCPLIVTMHNYGNVAQYSKADRIIALSDNHAKYIHSNGCPDAKVDIIPNFSRMPPSTFVTEPSSPLKFVAYGRFVHKKGFDVLLRAFAELVDEADNVSLTVVGDGPERQKLEDLIVQLGLGPHCSLKAWEDDIASLLDAHDVFILPSRSEPFGIVLLEAMARSKAIVATRSEGPVQFLTEQMAFLCEPGSQSSLTSALLRAFRQRKDLPAMARAGHALYLQRYYVAQVFPMITASYERCINRYRQAMQERQP